MVVVEAGMKPPVAAAEVVVDMDSEGGGDLEVHMEHDVVDFDDNWNLEGFGGMKK